MAADITATGMARAAPTPHTHARPEPMTGHPRSSFAERRYCVDVVEDPAALQLILESFARDAGRSVYVAIETPDWSWSGGVAADELRPMASLLKLAIAMAVEPFLDELASQRAGDLVRRGDVSVLHSLAPSHELSPRELLALMLSASDAPSARWATACAGLEAVRDAAYAAGLDPAEIVPDDIFGVLGRGTARNAVDLMRAAADSVRFPACAQALRYAIVNSRIPLGVTAGDFDIAHKTGTLLGVANDVAHLSCSRGEVWAAFLSEAQDDTLVAGYDMGICTRELLEYAGLQVSRTTSFYA